MQVLKRDNPLRGPGLSLHQRLSYLSTLLGWFDSWRTLGYVLLPALTLLSGGLPVAAPWLTFLVLFLGSFAVQRVALRLLSRDKAPLLHSTLFEFVRLPASFAATLNLFGSGPTTFAVTPKAGASQRSRSTSPALLVALMVLSVLSGLWYGLTLAGLTPITYGTPWVAHGAAFWLAVNAAFLAAATQRIRALRFAGDRRGSWRFGVDLPVVAHRTDGPTRGRTATGDAGGTGATEAMTMTLADVSVEGARLVVPAFGAVLEGLTEGSRLALRLPTAPRTELPVEAEVRSVKPGARPGTLDVGVRFDLPTDRAARLALALHRVPAPLQTHVPAPRSATAGTAAPVVVPG